jgi:hypothetical protein
MYRFFEREFWFKKFTDEAKNIFKFNTKSKSNRIKAIKNIDNKKI